MKKLVIAISAFLMCTAAYAASGIYKDFPQLGNTQNTSNPPGPTFSTTCTSFGNNGVCNQYQPYGPTYLQGTETFLVDSNYSNNNPVDFSVPTSFFGQGMGNVQVVTTNASVALANGVSTLISNQGVATIALINLPPNPVNNQIVKIVNAGSGVLTLTSIAVASGSGQSIVQGAQAATLAVQTNNAAAAAESWTSYIYQSSNSTWYRMQ